MLNRLKRTLFMRPVSEEKQEELNQLEYQKQTLDKLKGRVWQQGKIIEDLTNRAWTKQTTDSHLDGKQPTNWHNAGVSEPVRIPSDPITIEEIDSTTSRPPKKPVDPGENTGYEYSTVKLLFTIGGPIITFIIGWLSWVSSTVIAQGNTIVKLQTVVESLKP